MKTSVPVCALHRKAPIGGDAGEDTQWQEPDKKDTERRPGHEKGPNNKPDNPNWTKLKNALLAAFFCLLVCF